jgi:1-deoxy-D-xylulose-5-phosphate synthase
MCEGTGLLDFSKQFEDRFFDVGIAEEHAVTFAAGLAASGKKPVVALYSSFLQRAYDQVIHDVAIQSLPVVFAIDRAGFVQNDGVTHQGIFDLGALLQIPNITVLTPESYEDMMSSLAYALSLNTPSAIRYHKGYEPSYDRSVFTDCKDFAFAKYGLGRKVTIISYGRTVANAVFAAEKLKEEYEVTVVAIKKVKPLDINALFEFIANSEFTVFIEEQIRCGGASEHILSSLACIGKVPCKAEIIAPDEDFPTHASIQYLHRYYGMDADSIADLVKNKI